MASYFWSGYFVDGAAQFWWCDLYKVFIGVQPLNRFQTMVFSNKLAASTRQPPKGSVVESEGELGSPASWSGVGETTQASLPTSSSHLRSTCFWRTALHQLCKPRCSTKCLHHRAPYQTQSFGTRKSQGEQQLVEIRWVQGGCEVKLGKYSYIMIVLK